MYGVCVCVRERERETDRARALVDDNCKAHEKVRTPDHPCKTHETVRLSIKYTNLFVCRSTAQISLVGRFVIF